MSLLVFTRRVLSTLPRNLVELWASRWRARVAPMTFQELIRRRQMLSGGSQDRSPCQCPQCRHERQVRRS